MQQHLFIGGEWKAASSYTTLKSPYSGEIIAEVVGTVSWVDVSVVSCFPQPANTLTLTESTRIEII